jgi:hypothetical protein
VRSGQRHVCDHYSVEQNDWTIRTTAARAIRPKCWLNMYALCYRFSSMSRSAQEMEELLGMTNRAQKAHEVGGHAGFTGL